MATALSPDGAGLAAAMIRGWGVPRSVLLAIAGFQADDEHFRAAPTSAIAELLGLWPGNVQRALQMLVEARVLDVWAGVGRRPNAYRIRGDVWRWNVPWRRPPEEVAATLSARGVIVHVFRSSLKTRSTKVVVHSKLRRDNGHSDRMMSTQSFDATTDPCSLSADLGTTPLLTQSFDATTGPEFFGDREQLEEVVVEENSLVAETVVAEFVKRTTAAMYRKTGRPLVSREYLADLAAVGRAGLPVERGERVIAEADQKFRNPMLVRTLQAEVALLEGERDAGGAADPPLSVVSTRRALVMASYVDAGGGRITERFFFEPGDVEAGAERLRTEPSSWLPPGATEPIVEQAN